MQKKNTHITRTAVVVASLVLLAVLLRYLAVAYRILPTPAGVLRSFIYIGLFGAWGVSVALRIVQRQIRRYLLAASALTVFWMVVRTAKYFVVREPSATRLLWYSYYIPMLFIPLMAVFVALSLGKAENYHLPKRTALLFVPTSALVLLVLTNDFHQLVFSFPADAGVWTDELYTYSSCYWIIIGWMILCAVASLVTMLLKCRVPQSRRFLRLPFVPFGASVLYGMAYVSGLPGLRFVAGDLTAAQCLLFTAVFECCIQSGLIRSNTGYDLLFHASTVCAHIVDKNYDVVYSSAFAVDIPKEILKQTEGGVVALDRNTLIGGSPIHGGFVVWQDDVTELADTMDKLREKREQTANANEVERENYNTLRLINQLREKNRLYDLVQEQTARQNGLISELLDAYYQAETESERRETLAKAAVLGAYIKRRGNLVVLREQNERLPTGELSLCLNESIQSLSLMGVKCEQTFKSQGTMAATSVMRIYDLFESVVEATLGCLSGLWIHVSEKQNDMAVHIEAVTNADLSMLARDGVCVTREEDGTCCLTLRLPKGGEVA